MKVKDVMVRKVITIQPGKTLREAAEKMVDNRIGSLIVVKGSELAGLITETDIMKALAEGGDPSKSKISEIMTTNLYLVSPNDELEDAVALMQEKKIKRLPVISGSQLAGIVTATDICAAEPRMMEALAKVMFVPKTGKGMAG